LLILSIATLCAFAVLLSLGTWQLERKAWKEGLIATLQARLSATPQPLPAASSWPSLARADYEFTRVRLNATFLSGLNDTKREARVYTSGSALRDDIKSPGYFLFAPARLPDGTTVVINRGYVANPHPSAATPPMPLPPGPVDVVGVMRWPERPNVFNAAYNAADDLWFVRNSVSMAARSDWGSVAPFYIDMESPVPPGGQPHPTSLRPNLPNQHLQYAVTWYGLALVLVGVFAAFVHGRWRSTGPKNDIEG
jgi:surfeit locus 1 family protein